ncbi:MAG: DUF362 domain-containing protein [Acidobacteriota bacterium]
MNRREFIPLAGAALLTGVAGFVGGRKDTPERTSHSTVAIARATSYLDDLAASIVEGIQACGLQVADKKILLKPHLASFTSDQFTNTHPAVVAAAYAAFQELGASEVRIGDAPAAHRDTWALAEAAGYRDHIPNFDEVFVDLNGDDVAPVEGFGNGRTLYLPVTALRADIVVSLAKMKTDTGQSAALSMTNLFGLFPGAVYGWSGDGSIGKTEHGMGTPRAAADLIRLFRRSFAIVDGILGMEGPGPVNGSPRSAGVLVMGRDLVAVDATSCRIMGLDPGDVEYLKLAADREGVAARDRIKIVGSSLTPTPFRPA